MKKKPNRNREHSELFYSYKAWRDDRSEKNSTAPEKGTDANDKSHANTGEKKYHQPVLLDEILQFFSEAPQTVWVDGTLGDGGHTIEFLRKFPGLKMIGVDQDPRCWRGFLNAFGEWNGAGDESGRITMFEGNFCNIPSILKELGIRVGGILLDIGLSGYHFEDARRGFSFLDADSLDMRMNPDIPLTAEDIINDWDADEIREMFFKYGQERWSHAIVRGIESSRVMGRISSAKHLAEIVERVVPRKFWGPIHPATRIFQALRIFVNQELELLEKTIPAAAEFLEPGGVFGIISFHSLEDRIVKHAFRELVSKGDFKKNHKKPIIPSEDEVSRNKKSRSAKLRIIRKIES